MPETNATSSSAEARISKDLPPHYAAAVKNFFSNIGISDSFVDKFSSKDTFSDLICDSLNVLHLQRGRVSCLFSVLPLVTNYFNGLHGGAVASIAERVSIACARTVVGEDKEVFLGELGISYLSAATQGEVVVVDGNVVRSGRNLTVVDTEFRNKKTGKLIYTSHATFYHMPVAKL